MAKRGRKPFLSPVTITYKGKRGIAYRRGVGRPTKFLQEYSELVYHARALGKTDPEIIDMLRVNSDTFYTWLREKPEFSEKYHAGLRDLEQHAARSLFYKLQSKTLIRTETKDFIDRSGTIRKLKTKIEQEIPPDVLALNNYLNRRVKSFRVDLLEDPNTEKVDMLLTALAKLVPDKMQAKLDELKNNTIEAKPDAQIVNNIIDTPEPKGDS